VGRHGVSSNSGPLFRGEPTRRSTGHTRSNPFGAGRSSAAQSPSASPTRLLETKRGPLPVQAERVISPIDRLTMCGSHKSIADLDQSDRVVLVARCRFRIARRLCRCLGVMVSQRVVRWPLAESPPLPAQSRPGSQEVLVLSRILSQGCATARYPMARETPASCPGVPSNTMPCCRGTSCSPSSPATRSCIPAFACRCP
jgi:hypothetical protein